MRLLTPAEYADAYGMWAAAERNTDTQMGRITAQSVSTFLEPQAIRAQAEIHRQAAVKRYHDSPDDILLRRLHLTSRKDYTS